MPAAAITVRGLKMRYGDVEVLKGIDLEVASGEILGFLGPNGAGKTTTIEILEGYRQRTAGEVSVLGVDPDHPTRAWRDRIGLVLQECELDPLLTVRETLRLYSAFYRSPRPIDEVISLVGLTGREKSRLGALSGGQRRRADVAVALVGDPDLIFLDEPTTGFDPTARREAWNTIEELKQLGKTVLLTTHYMEEAQHLADRVAIIRGGEIVVEGRPDEIVGEGNRQAIISFRAPAGVAPDRIAAVAELPVTADGARVVLESDDAQAVLHQLTAWADREQLALEAIEVRRPSLEDVFLELTQAAERSGNAETNDPAAQNDG
ncbi:MAG: ABC transporter ATP-binding protein [Actinomycetota bacterium]|nr:ABC transporter ATP-binding protein [Actinomycetota bacterium]